MIIGWEEAEVDGRAGFRLAKKLKFLKGKIKDWAKDHFGDVERDKVKILEDIKILELKEELSQLSKDELLRWVKLKEEFHRKLREEEIRWTQRSHCKWLQEGNKNTISPWSGFS